MVAQIDMEYLRHRPGRLWSRLISYAMFEGRPLTTRGQWINPILFRLFALQSRLPRLKKVSAPIFILGTGRSGTTILGVVMSMHRDISFLNEPKAIWAYLRPDEDLIGSYHRGKARYRLAAEDATRDVTSKIERIYGFYLRITGGRRVLDKYPELIFRIPFLLKMFPDAKFIFLSRNGWDTCASITQWSSRLGVTAHGETHDWWGVNGRKWDLLVDQIISEHPDLSLHLDEIRTFSDQRARAATEWIVTMREGLRLLQQHPASVIHISYEKLCADPTRVLSEICQFAGLEPDEVFLQFARQKLSPPRPHLPFALPEIIEEPFRNTINRLEIRH